LGLTLQRKALYRRIDQRVEAMVAAGLEAEVRGLVEAGYGFDLPAMSGVGYGQWAPYVVGKATLDEVVRDIQQATRRVVRHQYNWFRLDDPRITWFDVATDPYTAALAEVGPFVALA
jgi:tRNA dimethylallyltransferase